jgi:DNA-binding CsgD family transcriptional regulator
MLAAGRTQPVVSLYTKIGVHRRAEAVTWAIRHGLS